MLSNSTNHSPPYNAIVWRSPIQVCQVWSNPARPVEPGENWELGTNQSVFCRVTTLFNKSAKVWKERFNWPVCAGFQCLKSKEISQSPRIKSVPWTVKSPESNTSATSTTSSSATKHPTHSGEIRETENENLICITLSIRMSYVVFLLFFFFQTLWYSNKMQNT